ncbi:DNA-3-methyladenine glycosylase [Sphingomonas sp. RT2P30]|uniref:DNA-3-methyladenine glycosylase n=1 Tax=Parasphingomonas halimpatiens TaxID=3096162 RepID=UPI002FC9FE15
MTDGAPAKEGQPLSPDFFARDVETVARALIGTTLLVDGVGGTIVETEAYDASDPASHCFGGRTARNASMFGPPGHSYVYRSYGLHWCLNFVCVPASGVLIRAIEPTIGIDRMIARRGMDELRRLCAGPGRLCQAFGIDSGFDGRSLDAPPFALAHGGRAVAVGAGPRIGISKAADTPWRFWREGSRFLSRPAAAPVRR